MESLVNITITELAEALYDQKKCRTYSTDFQSCKRQATDLLDRVRTDRTVKSHKAKRKEAVS